MNLNISALSNLDVGKLLKRKEAIIYLLILVTAFFTARIIYQKQKALADSLKKELTEQEEVNWLSLELDKTESDFAKLRKNIPVGKISTVSFVELITQLAKARNISISSITPRSQADRGFYWEYPFEIEMTADYRQSRGFLSDIENSQYLFRVNSLAVGPASFASAKDAKRSRVRMGIYAISAKK